MAVHKVEFINEEGNVISKEILIEDKDSSKLPKNGQQILKNESQIMTNEYEKEIPKFSSSLFEGRDLADLDFSLNSKSLKTPSKSLVTGSLVNALQQSLVSNDVETINWALANTDEKVIINTIKAIDKDSIKGIITNLFIKF